tara:strand:- start:322 stop:747 length:426 start_codon:yes stop_codon:yes gene_type:complete
MIRKMVREEVAITIREVISEIVDPTSKIPESKTLSKPKRKVVEQKHFSNNSVLNDILNETAAEGDWKTMGGGVSTTDDMANIMAKSYGDMMSNNSQGVDVKQMAAESGVQPEAVPDHLEKALTRDYSKLVKAMGNPGGDKK